MNQISVSRVNLDDLKSRRERSLRRFAKCGYHVSNLTHAQRVRRRIAVVVSERARPNRLPSARSNAHWLAANPWQIRARFATRVRELHPNMRALRLHKLRDRLPRFNV